MFALYIGIKFVIGRPTMQSTSHKTCTWFCCALSWCALFCRDDCIISFSIKTVVGFLRKNAFEKCVTRWSIIFICNTFSCWLVLLSFLYIDLTLLCCRNPENVHCFETISPNLKFVLHQSIPPVRSPCNPTTREVAQLSNDAVGADPDGEQPKTALWLWVCKITWYLYTGGVCGRMKAK